MKFVGDYHTHTVASDGYSTLQENVAEAVKKRLEELVISDHGFQTVLEGMTLGHTLHSGALTKSSPGRT